MIGGLFVMQFLSQTFARTKSPGSLSDQFESVSIPTSRSVCAEISPHCFIVMKTCRPCSPLSAVRLRVEANTAVVGVQRIMIENAKVRKWNETLSAPCLSLVFAVTNCCAINQQEVALRTAFRPSVRPFIGLQSSMTDVWKGPRKVRVFGEKFAMIRSVSRCAISRSKGTR